MRTNKLETALSRDRFNLSGPTRCFFMYVQVKLIYLSFAPHIACTCVLLQLKNAEYFSQFVTEDFEQYINRKRSDHSYGNNLEMQAMAEMYNRAIEVHQYSIGECSGAKCVYTTEATHDVSMM